jgi:hypothetical protein
MATSLHESSALSHPEAVRPLDCAIAEMEAARTECHRGLRHAAERHSGEDAFEYAAGAVDVYAACLQQALNEIFALKLQYPDAWDPSEGGRRHRAVLRELDRIVVESLNHVLGYTGASHDTDTERSAPAVD